MGIIPFKCKTSKFANSMLPKCSSFPNYDIFASHCWPSISNIRDKYKSLMAQLPKYMRAESSAKKIRVHWAFPKLPAPIGNFDIQLTIILTELEGGNGRPMGSAHFGFVPQKMCLPAHLTSIEFQTVPGSQYAILLDLVYRKEKNETILWCRDGITARATFSLSEMELLMGKAVDFVGDSPMRPFKNFFRARPTAYWRAKMGQGRMEVYRKDSNGQAASPINQNIDGLFFNAFAHTPSESSVGNRLLVVPALDLLDCHRDNLYFADFYCNRKDSKHYVTIVATRRGSAQDRYCQNKLIRLDPSDNPFLRFRQTTPDSPGAALFKLDSGKGNGLWLELFYTENVPLKKSANIKTITPEGNGISLPRGLAHCKTCQICNIHPEEEEDFG